MKSVADRLGELARPTGEEDLMRVAYPAPRLRVTARQGALVAAVLAVAVVVWLIVSSGPEKEISDAAPASGVPVPPLSATAAPGEAGSSGELVVSVVGHVARPGLVTLPPGARAADALEAAGALEGVDPGAVNLAQRLTDGEQLVVPAPGEPVPEPAPAPGPSGGSGGGSGGGGAVSLNSADAAELTTLQGVGEVTAAAIVEHRESIGGFTSIDQLTEVRGIGPAKLEALRDQVTL
ncbi:helix-hairpin-helix domain-containing protein [Corynebacterium sp. MSK006]|uniref:ComEA family DNA-binding protein n=1 Tax=Corynebacterium sp. MSK006 TaxID=3050187 RepID=UPI00254A45D8|nr:helix-hairpin-helix domain-containing protein [Corynebacterium sp. MSK006]MDK8894555.1 helix-hairpin-helix domain-containing protein [Corynebacterium sp. MSK006]